MKLLTILQFVFVLFTMTRASDVDDSTDKAVVKTSMTKKDLQEFHNMLLDILNEKQKKKKVRRHRKAPEDHSTFQDLTMYGDAHDLDEELQHHRDLFFSELFSNMKTDNFFKQFDFVKDFFKKFKKNNAGNEVKGKVDGVMKGIMDNINETIDKIIREIRNPPQLMSISGPNPEFKSRTLRKKRRVRVKKGNAGKTSHIKIPDNTSNGGSGGGGKRPEQNDPQVIEK